MFAKMFSVRTKAAVVAAVVAALAIPVIATSDAWNWKDRSGLLPYRDHFAITQIAERQGSWLLSDNTHLYRFNHGQMTDLTHTLRDRGMLGVSNIYSDGRSWMVVYRPIDGNHPRIALYDGNVWTDLTGKFPQASETVRAAGNEGIWYVRSYAPATASAPGSWELYRWQGGNAMPEKIETPIDLSTKSAGCFSYADKSKLCNGWNGPVFVNNAWYFIGGSPEARGAEDNVTQAGQGKIWKLNGTVLEPIKNIPAFKFVSGVWTSKGAILIATSNATTNPFAPDRYWIFNGNELRDITEAATSAGLLASDARNVRAAWNGRSWMIVADKQHFRFDGVAMANEGRTRDLFSALASDGNGTFAIGGAVSDINNDHAHNPLTAKFVTAEEDLTAAPKPIMSGVLSAVLSKLYGPTVTVAGTPKNNVIGNGKVFTFTANAEDANGIDRIDIFVQGARVKSCFERMCEYSQIYWSNNQPIRRVDMFARAINKKGYANDSETLTLKVDESSRESAWAISTTDYPTLDRTTVPAGMRWQRDDVSGIVWATWIDPANAKLRTHGAVTYNVAAIDGNSVQNIEIRINGTSKRTCGFSTGADVRTCKVTLEGREYPLGSEIFANANIHNGLGKNSWTAGSVIRRETMQAEAAVVTSPVPSPAVGAVYRSEATMTPDGMDVTRGNAVTFRVKTENNTHGVEKVDIHLNGSVQRICSYGAATSPVDCATIVDTSPYAPGTVLNFVARAVDTQGHDLWSNGKTIRVIASRLSPNAPNPTNGMSAWDWLAPNVGLLSDGQNASYTVGAWSPNGMGHIDMIVDGMVKKSCSFGGATGNKECSITIAANEYGHGHATVVNARAVDAAGDVRWTEPRSITIKRVWMELQNNGPYINISTDRPLGYKAGDPLILSAKGWSPNGVERIDLYWNGALITKCPNDLCTWTSHPVDGAFVEYQARLVDRTGTETWSGITGLRKKQ